MDGLDDVAIAIPLDLVLDVMRNAAPAGMQQKQNRGVLADTAVNDGSAHFADILNASASQANPADDLILNVLNAADSNKLADARGLLSRFGGSVDHSSVLARGSAENSPQKSFEQMFIRNMLESMLPAADSGIYGDEGASSGVWRSLAADQLATVYTNAGGLGIASEVLKPGSDDGMVAGPQWPYFVRPAITSYSG